MKKVSVAGCLCGVMAGIFWAMSGVAGQYLFETRGVETAWLVPIRLTVSGLVLFAYALVTDRQELLALPRRGGDFIRTVITGVFGSMMVQATFFQAVKVSNAGTATVLQYLAPAFIMLFTCMREKRRPVKVELLAILLAMSGTFLISTHGNFHELVITPEALFWGLASALGLVTNTILPVGLYRKYSTLVITAWSFLIGGTVLALLLKPWQYHVQWDFVVLALMFVIVIVGSALAYIVYALTVKWIGPTRASLFSTSEPVSATALSALLLGTEFLFVDLVGFVLILSVVFLLTLTQHREHHGRKVKNHT